MGRLSQTLGPSIDASSLEGKKLASKLGSTTVGKLEEAVFKEGVSAFQEWRQKSKNGILPIGISAVGKTTLLSKFDVAGPNLFLDFNRTLRTTIDKSRMRREFAERCNGIEYVQKIDVPGELPEQWSQAYFDRNPRILVVLVDDRSPEIHTNCIRQFLKQIKSGPTFWQVAKTLFGFRTNNLSRVIFVVNKSDKIGDDSMLKLLNDYRPLLADIQSSFNVSVQIFQSSLTIGTEKSLEDLFSAIIDGLTRK